VSAIRILHVEDEPDIREIVDMSLALNPEFEVRACASGAEALAVASEWSPALILLDVIMPGMDGPATLAQLRRKPETADIPVLFMTARAQAREIEHFIALGAQGVISKPFDPMTLGSMVRSHLQSLRLDKLRNVFVRRAKADAAILKSYRMRLARNSDPTTLDQVWQIAHTLAGTAGLYGFEEIGRAASAVEKAIEAKLEGADTQVDLRSVLEHLIARLENEWNERSAAVA